MKPFTWFIALKYIKLEVLIHVAAAHLCYKAASCKFSCSMSIKGKQRGDLSDQRLQVTGVSYVQLTLRCFGCTCIFPGTPVLSILLATLTVFPQMSYWGRRAPITPATTGPTLIPLQTWGNVNIKQRWTAVSHSHIVTFFVIELIVQYKARRTHSQDKLIVWLIVDFIQNVKHLNGVVRYCAQMVVNRFFGLKGKDAQQLGCMHEMILHIVFILMYHIRLYTCKHTQKHKITCHLGTNGGDEAHSCHVCTANGFDFLYVFVALLVHELQHTHSTQGNTVKISERSAFKVTTNK